VGCACVQVEALEKSLSAENNAKKIDDMETELEIAGSEVRRLQKALEDMEEWKEKLVKESRLPIHSRIKLDSDHTHCCSSAFVFLFDPIVAANEHVSDLRWLLIDLLTDLPVF